MSGKWEEVRIDEICQFNKNSYSVSENWDFVNYLDTGNLIQDEVKEYQHIILENEKLPSRARRKVQFNDILYSTVRPNQLHYGIVKNVVPNMLVSTGFTVITVNPEIADSEFVYYFLIQNEITELLHSIGEQSTSAYPSIKPTDIGNLKIKLPSLNIQKEIACTLRSIDDKISLNQKLNHHLEEIGKAAFDEFIIKNSSYEPEITLNEIIEVNPIRQIKKGTITTFIEMSSLPTVGLFPSSWSKKEFTSGMKFQNGDTLLARITPSLENGKTAFIDFLEKDEIAFGSTEFIVLAPKSGIASALAYFLVRDKEFRQYAEKNLNGTSGRQRVSAEAIKIYQLHKPTKNNLLKFDEITKPIMDSITQLSLENKRLSQIRDTLLPKLLSGEISVSQDAK